MKISQEKDIFATQAPVFDDRWISPLNLWGSQFQRQRVELFGAIGERVIARWDARHRCWWLMHHADSGWESYGKVQTGLWSMIRRYALKAIRFDEDKCSVMLVLEITKA